MYSQLHPELFNLCRNNAPKIVFNETETDQRLKSLYLYLVGQRLSTRAYDYLIFRPFVFDRYSIGQFKIVFIDYLSHAFKKITHTFSYFPMYLIYLIVGIKFHKTVCLLTIMWWNWWKLKGWSTKKLPFSTCKWIHLTGILNFKIWAQF